MLTRKEFEKIHQQLNDGESVYKRWLPRVETVGKIVRIKSHNNVEEAYVEGINADGSLVLRRDDGNIVTLIAGEVTMHM